MLRVVAVIVALLLAVGAALWVVLAEEPGAKRGASSDGPAVVDNGEPGHVGAATGAPVESRGDDSGSSSDDGTVSDSADDEAPERVERDRYVPQPTDEFIWLEDDVAPRERMRHAVRMLCHEDRPDWVFGQTLHLAQQYPEIAAEELALGLRSEHGLDACCWILMRLGANAAPAIPELMRFLADHPDPIAGVLVSIGDAAAAAVARGLRHADVEVRAELIDRLEGSRWLHEQHEPPSEVVGAVSGLTADGDVRVRRSAVELSLVWAPTPTAAAKLVRQGLGDPEPIVRETAIESLSDDVAELVLDDLIGALDDLSVDVSTTAGYALAELGEAAARATPAVLRKIRSASASGRTPDDVWFSALGAVDRAALRGLLSHDDENVRAEAARHVVYGMRSRADVDAVVAALADPSAVVRFGALGALNRTGNLARLDHESRQAVLLALGKRLESERRDERQGALSVLVDQPELPASLAGPLAVVVNDEDAGIRGAAARALALLPAGATPEADVALAKALTAALLDESLRVRRATLETVRTAGVSDEDLIRAVRRLLVSEDVHEQVAAARALVALEPTAPEPATVFAEHRVHRNQYVRKIVVQGVGELALASPTRRSKALDHLRNRLADGDLDVRLAAVHALTPLGRDAAPAMPELIAKLERGYPQVWLAIFDTLIAIGPEAAPAADVLRRLTRAELKGVRDGAQRVLDALEGAATDSKRASVGESG